MDRTICNWHVLWGNRRGLPVTVLSLTVAAGCTIAQSPQCAAASQSIPVKIHSGSSKDNARSGNLDDTINKMRTSAPRLSLPMSLFDPWWRTMQHDPDASWILRNFDIMSSDFDRQWTFPVGVGSYIPRADSSDNGDEIRISVEVPGIDENNLDVTINEDSVTIKGEKMQEAPQSESKSASKVERAYGSFERTIMLPARVDRDRAHASLKNGVLTIVLPKDKMNVAEPKKLKISKE